VQLYLDAFLVSGNTGQAEVARDILNYVLRDMTDAEGGFYSAEDADSEGHEGKFYCWTRAELEKLLSPEEFTAAVRYFGITEQGNFVDHSHPHPLPNQNVLSIVEPGIADTQKALVASVKMKMLDARAKRVRPHLDDKVLASWNGLMLSAFARAYAVLGDDNYRAAAEKNVKFIQNKLWEPGAGKKVGALYHRWRDGERDDVELLEGYAFLLAGVIDLYEATLQPQHLDFAIALAEAMLANFFDRENGGFWQSLEARDLIFRQKEVYDGAEPSGNSVATLALLKLGAITGRKEFTDAAEKTLQLFAIRLEQGPQAVPYLLSALDFSLQQPLRAVVAGDAGSPAARDLLQSIHSVYQPNKVVLGNTGPVEEFALTLRAKDGVMTYVCTGNACQPPTRDRNELKNLLK
jgi:uncharacterized protein YyaL (SSP411 family)